MRSIVAVEKLIIILFSREMSGLNLSPQTGYPEIFGGFPELHQAGAGKLPYNESLSLASTS
jgi:hypothetical protein